jgi:hypothetical protein
LEWDLSESCPSGQTTEISIENMIVYVSKRPPKMLDIFAGRGADQNSHSVRITTTFSGGVAISVNETITAQTRVRGYPVSVYGSSGKFDFQMNMNGHSMGKHSVVFMNMESIHVAVPSHPLTTPSKFEILTNGLPALPGSRRPPVEDKFNYGVHEVRRPFFDFSTMRVGADPARPADQMLDTIDRMIMVAPFSVLSYGRYGIVCFIFYLAIRVMDILCMKLRAAQNSGIRIVPDQNEPHAGTFNEMPCHLVRSAKTNPRTLRELQGLHIQGIMKLRAFEKQDGHFLIVYPLLDRFDFSMAFDPTGFLSETMKILRSLFESGHVHGSITEESFFLDSARNVLIGGLEDTFERTSDDDRQSRDTSTVARIVRRHISENSSDPLLLDLLDRMEGAAIKPIEVLGHPLFWTPEHRIDFLSQFSDVLQSKVSYLKGHLARFEEMRQTTIGNNWMAALDQELVVEATRHVTYQGYLMADLIRLIRNKWHHVPMDARGRRLAVIGTTPANYFQYFHGKFPRLFMAVYRFAEEVAPDSIPSQ